MRTRIAKRVSCQNDSIDITPYFSAPTLSRRRTLRQGAWNRIEHTPRDSDHQQGRRTTGIALSTEVPGCTGNSLCGEALNNHINIEHGVVRVKAAPPFWVCEV